MIAEPVARSSGRQLVFAGDCGWCRRPIIATRRDARYCSKPCRQAAHRTGIRRAELERDAAPARLAYADPPYPGKARLYRGHPDYAGEVDHAELLSRLATFDGWALSTSADALAAVLRDASAVDPRHISVAAWVKRPYPHPTARRVNAWEPVIYVPARSLPDASGIPDALVGVASRRRPTLPGAVLGMKPPAFCLWVFGLLGARPGDDLADLFPGSGIVGWTWDRWASRPAGADA